MHFLKYNRTFSSLFAVIFPFFKIQPYTLHSFLRLYFHFLKYNRTPYSFCTVIFSFSKVQPYIPSFSIVNLFLSMLSIVRMSYSTGIFPWQLLHIGNKVLYAQRRRLSRKTGTDAFSSVWTHL